MVGWEEGESASQPKIRAFDKHVSCRLAALSVPQKLVISDAAPEKYGPPLGNLQRNIPTTIEETNKKKTHCHSTEYTVLTKKTSKTGKKYFTFILFTSEVCST